MKTYERVIVVADYDLKKIINENFSEHISKIVFIDDPIFQPAFGAYDIVKQAIILNPRIKRIHNDYGIQVFVSENDCMSLSQILLSTYFHNKRVNIEIYQGLREASKENLRNWRRTAYRSKFGIIAIPLLYTKIIAGNLFLLLALVLNNRLQYFSFSNYINRNAISGLKKDCRIFYYSQDYFNSAQLRFSKSTLVRVKHPLADANIPLSYFGRRFEVGENINLVLVPMEVNDPVWLNTTLNKFRNHFGNLDLKFHPAMCMKFLQDFKSSYPFWRSLPLDSSIANCLLSYNKFFDLSPYGSSVEELVNFINERDLNLCYYNYFEINTVLR